MSIPGSSARGLQHNVYMVGTTHGQAQLPTLSSISIDPSTKEEVVAEMGTPYGVLTVQFYEKFSGQLDYTTTDDDTIMAMFMDTLPTSGQASVYVPHLTYQAPFTLYGNQTHMMSQKIFQGFVAAQCLGVATKKQSSNSSEMVTIKFTGTQLYVVNAGGSNARCAVQYSRCVAGSPPVSRPGDITFSTATATLPQTVTPFPLPGSAGTTQPYLLVLKNGTPVTTGFTLSGTTLVLGTTPASTDVWETFYVYLP